MNNLWKPETIPQPKVRTVKNPPANGFDAVICKSCPHRGKVCNAPCPPVTWIDGKDGGKEPIASRMKLDPIKHETDDYKETISELSAHYDPPDMIGTLRTVSNYRNRLIALGILGWIPNETIMDLMHIPRMTFYRLLRHMKATRTL